MNEENLVKILEELKEVRTKTRTKVNDNILWDTAVRIYNSEEIEAKRQGKTNFVKESTSFQKTSFQNPSPASQSQKNLLKKLGYKGDFNLTKKEAWEITKNTKRAK